MTVRLSTDIRNARLQIILDTIDIASEEYDGAHLLICSGSRPETGEEIDEYDEILVNFEFSTPCGIINDGVLSFYLGTALGLVEGTASWARIIDATGLFVIDLSVTEFGLGGDVIINDSFITEGVEVVCTIASFTEGNL